MIGEDAANTENISADSLFDRIMFILMQGGVSQLDEIGRKLRVLICDYTIGPKSEALTVCTEGKNDYLIKRFLLAKAVAGCTKRTIERYGKDLHRCFLDIGKDADTVTTLDVQGLLARIIQRSSTATADNYRRVLSTFFAWCYREELIGKNPMNRVDAIKVHRKKKTAFSDMECELIRAHCRSMRESAIVELLFSTGCRVSELAGIRLDDIDGKSIDILGKGEKHRNVYLNAKAQLAVSRYLAERADTNPYLFPRMDPECRSAGQLAQTARAKENWYKIPNMVAADGGCDKGTIESIVKGIGKRAGVDNVHPHRFRRTCATLALSHGMPLEQVSKMLGHAQLSTTQIYLDLGEKDLELAHARFVT